MTNAYLADGTLVSTLKSDAKAQKKISGAKLTDAQDRVAQAHGYANWQQMIESTITLDEEFTENFTMVKRAGQDSYVLHLDFLEDCDYLDRTGTAFRKMFAKRDLLLGADSGTVEHHIDFVFAEDATRSHGLHVLSDAPSTRHINPAVNEVFASNDASAFIAILNDNGFFANLEGVLLDEVEFEAELMLTLRKMGRSIGERVLFNIASIHDQGGHQEIDWERRCFANMLDNGDVVVSNGQVGDDLRFKILAAAEFKTLEQEMYQACGRDAATSGRGEIWMFDRILAADPEAELQPGF